MNIYRYTVKLTVEVEAFDEGDAFDAVQDEFGIGSAAAVNVVECEYIEMQK